MANAPDVSAVLCVTAFRDIGRGDWGGPGDPHGEWRRSSAEYVSWFLNLAASPVRLVCFCDEPVASVLREAAPGVDVRPYDEEDTLFRHLPAERRIMASPEFAARLGPARLRHPEHSVPEYNLVQHSKTSFVHRAASLPEFAACTHVAWVDFGYLRSPSAVPTPEQVRRTWSAVATPDRITYASFRATVRPADVPDPETLCRTAPSVLQGSMFVLPRHLAAWYEAEYERSLLAYHALGLADDDQALALHVLKRHPERFALRLRPEWFSMFAS